MEETEPEQSNKQSPTTPTPIPTPTYTNQQHHQYIQEEEEEQKFTAFANRDNSDYKWKRARNVLGVLEIASEPILKPRDEFQPRPATKGREMIFQQALDSWEQERLRSELIVVLESLPVETCCCGLFRDHESTKKDFVKLLNDKWAKTANKKLSRHGFKIDFFLWNWQNASGKAETNIILIRFFILSSYGLRAAAAAAGDAIGAGGGFHFSDELSESYRIPAPTPPTPTAPAPTAPAPPPPTATTAPAPPAPPTVTAPALAATTNTNIDYDEDDDEQIIEA